MATSRLCSIPDCGKPSHARGWCTLHYQRWKAHGDPLAGVAPRPPKGEPERFYREVVLTDTRGRDDPCLIWPFSRSPNGYGQLRLDNRLLTVSRILCEEVYGPPPTPDHEGAHGCGKGGDGCVTKSHLRWATHAENEADKIEHGTSNRGERCGTAKITEPEVREIMMLKGYLIQPEIAALFGITFQTVSKIHRKERWAWLW